METNSLPVSIEKILFPRLAFKKNRDLRLLSCKSNILLKKGAILRSHLVHVAEDIRFCLEVRVGKVFMQQLTQPICAISAAVEAFALSLGNFRNPVSRCWQDLQIMQNTDKGQKSIEVRTFHLPRVVAKTNFFK